MSKLLAALAVGAALLAVPATAGAATLRGKTSQGQKVSLTVGADGVPTRVRIDWRAPCKRKAGQSARGPTIGTPPFMEATADILRDGGTYRQRFDGGLRARITASLEGRRSGTGWSGTFAVRKLFSRRGKVIDVCRAKRITWSVR